MKGGEAQSQELALSSFGLMTEVAKLSVPLVVDVGVGLNWDKAH
jgi:DNA polymerase I-like protein with 3'-5' exonuclease and polymerase domains